MQLITIKITNNTLRPLRIEERVSFRTSSEEVFEAAQAWCVANNAEMRATDLPDDIDEPTAATNMLDAALNRGVE